MKNRIVAGMLVLLLTVGCATMMSFEEREKTYGKEASGHHRDLCLQTDKPGGYLEGLPEGFRSRWGHGIHRGHRPYGRFGDPPDKPHQD